MPHRNNLEGEGPSVWFYDKGPSVLWLQLERRFVHTLGAHVGPSEMVGTRSCINYHDALPRNTSAAADPPRADPWPRRMRWPAARRAQTCIRMGPNIAVPTDPNVSPQAPRSAQRHAHGLACGPPASPTLPTTDHTPRTSLGGGKVLGGGIPQPLQPVKQHRTLRAQQLPERCRQGPSTSLMPTLMLGVPALPTRPTTHLIQWW